MPMESAALDLKSEREKKKISLSQIAADTRISVRYLQCIEEGRYNDLPGGLYTRAFLKAYCESIDLDPREMLEHYDAQALPQSEKNIKTRTPFPRQRTSSISGPILIWSIMLLLSVIGLFFSRAWISDLFSPYFSKNSVADIRYEPPDEPVIDAETPSPDSQNIPGNELSGNTVIAADAPAPPAESARSETENLTNIETATSPVSPVEIVEPKLRLEISAMDTCWLSIDRDGIPSARKLLEPGQVEVMDAQERFRIILGNAGGVIIKLNGKQTKPLGKRGEVIKIDIGLDNLQQYIDQSAG
jgi:cytoskeleton protein RodZ